jgi:hypothetical protein
MPHSPHRLGHSMNTPTPREALRTALQRQSGRALVARGINDAHLTIVGTINVDELAKAFEEELRKMADASEKLGKVIDALRHRPDITTP